MTRVAAVTGGAGTIGGAIVAGLSAAGLAQALAPGMAERGFGRIVFVVSDAAGAITGQTLCADGGLILR